MDVAGTDGIGYLGVHWGRAAPLSLGTGDCTWARGPTTAPAASVTSIMFTWPLITIILSMAFTASSCAPTARGGTGAPEGTGGG